MMGGMRQEEGIHYRDKSRRLSTDLWVIQVESRDVQKDFEAVVCMFYDYTLIL